MVVKGKSLKSRYQQSCASSRSPRRDSFLALSSFWWPQTFFGLGPSLQPLSPSPIAIASSLCLCLLLFFLLHRNLSPDLKTIWGIQNDLISSCLPVFSYILFSNKITFKRSEACPYLLEGHNSSYYIEFRIKGWNNCLMSMKKQMPQVWLFDIWWKRWFHTLGTAEVWSICVPVNFNLKKHMASPRTNWMRILRGWVLDVSIFQSFPGNANVWPGLRTTGLGVGT